MKISERTLQALGACPAQVDKFREIFGTKSVLVTEALCIEHAQVFDWGWAALRLLSASAWVEYKRAIASAGEAYNRAIAPAGEEYHRAIASAWWEYKRAKASAFGRLAEKEHQ